MLISFQLHYIVCIVLCNGKIYAIFQSLKLYPVFFVIKNRKTWLTLFKKNHFVLFSHVNHNQQWSESFFTNPNNTYPHFCSTANNWYESFWLILTMTFKLQIHKSSFYTLISESIHLLNNILHMDYICHILKAKQLQISKCVCFNGIFQ